ncbi:MAG: hypothetical protein J7L72_03310, partial [Candidatus Aminicenantes bacterium]|nr:hypothetical protein [Candidatus Aminicenantes bacterium]
GFEDFEFFYYKSHNRYHIIEAKSGLGLGGNFKRLKQAKKFAEEALKSIGVEKFQEQIEKKVAENGISPRYEEVRE